MNAVALTQELVRIRTVNPLDLERPAADRVGKLLEEAGWSVSTYEFAPGRASVVARREGAEGAPLCLAGHLDTVPLGAVPWSHDPFSGEVAGDRLYGRGSTDMKSGVAAIVAAALQLSKARLRGQGLTVVLVAGEENHVELAEFLIAKGADVNHPEGHGYLPTTRALWKGNTDILRLFKRHGATCQAKILGEANAAKCAEIHD